MSSPASISAVSATAAASRETEHALTQRALDLEAEVHRLAAPQALRPLRRVVLLDARLVEDAPPRGLERPRRLGIDQAFVPLARRGEEGGEIRRVHRGLLRGEHVAGLRVAEGLARSTTAAG